MSSKPDIQLFGTSELCFEKESFMRNDFNVDDFMREFQCSGDASLETLRDHLGIYLKVLRSAMIDLINRDYADFVNLSTNLTGLDGLIQALTVPLGQLREEVLSVFELLQSASSGVLAELEKHKIVNMYKQKLNTLTDVARRLDNLEELLNHGALNSKEKRECNMQTNKNISTYASLQCETGPVENLELEMSNLVLESCSSEEMLDRFAAELSYLRYLSKTCEGTKLMHIYQPRLSKIQQSVDAAIETNLITGLGNLDEVESSSDVSVSTNDKLLARTLGACAVMESEIVAEQVVRDLFAQKIKQILSEGSLKSNPQGLAGVLNTVLSSVNISLNPLIVLTVPKLLPDDTACEEEIPGFHFIEKAVFPEIVIALGTIRDLYSPANPTTFHQRYVECMKFLENIEKMLVSKQRIEAFRSQPSYQSFMDSWNLAVYFQIRNQEIGQAVESSLCEEDGLKLYTEACDNKTKSLPGHPFTRPSQIESLAWCSRLCSTRGVLRGLWRCWHDEVFLVPLLHRFWKLTLLILSRYRTWLSSTVVALEQGKLTAASALTAKLEKVAQSPPSRAQLLVLLLGDLFLLQLGVAQLYTACIEQHLGHAQDKIRDLVKHALSSEVSRLDDYRHSLFTLLSTEVSRKMTDALHPVLDTPRLYRRTNRSAPRQAQQYVTAALTPLLELHSFASQRLSSEQISQCCSVIASIVSKHYNELTHEVLANVSKTEESLRKLKRARGNAAATSTSQGASDEDKIREQLLLDVQHYGEQLRALDVDIDSIHEYTSLLVEVRSARSDTSHSSSL